MNLKTIRYFQTACHSRSVAEAARRCGISPQGLSLAIRRLEAEQGVPLLGIDNGVISITPYGRIYLQFCDETLQSLEKMRSSVATMRAHERGVIRLGCMMGFMGYVGEGAFDDARTSDGRPLEVSAEEVGTELELEQRLLEGSLDVGILAHPSSEELARRAILTDGHFVWMRRNHEFANRDCLTPHDLDGRALAVLGAEGRWVEALAKPLRSAGSTVQFVPVGEMVRVLELAYQGAALGLTTRNHVMALDGNGVLAAVPLDGVFFTYYLCHRRSYMLATEEIELLDYLRKLGERVKAETPSVSSARLPVGAAGGYTLAPSHTTAPVRSMQ